MVRPSFAMNTDSGACKAIIALTLPELNRSTSDGITPSGSVGSGNDSDIRGLLFVLVELRCCGDMRAVDWTSVGSLIDTRWDAKADQIVCRRCYVCHRPVRPHPSPIGSGPDSRECRSSPT